MKKTGYFNSSDGHSNIYYAIWEPQSEVKCVLQIVHGMCEYIDRYEHIAEYLNQFGILVCGEDHIGHGHSADPMCNYSFTLNGYLDLFGLLKFVNSPEWYKAYPKTLPTLIIAGSDDPVGGYGVGPAEVAEVLEKEGCGNIELIIYQGMRHELHNEIDKEIVYEDIKNFILGNIEAADGKTE